MSSIRPSVGVAAGQLDPMQFADYEELANATAGFAVVAVVVYLVGRLLLAPGVTRLVSTRNRNNPTLQSTTETYAHTVAIGALINGLSLVADPDFNAGDWISWPGGEGVVEAVDSRVTHVRAVNDEIISVPDMELMTSALTRPYGRERYRFTGRVDIAYADDVELVFRELIEAAWEDDRVLDDLEPTVCIAEFVGSSVGLRTEFWVGSPTDTNLVDVHSQYRWCVKRRFDEEGLTLGSALGREASGRPDVDLVGGRDGE